MTLAAEEEFSNIGETMGCADHDHDLVHELCKRLDALRRYDEYVSNAVGKPSIQALWRKLRRQEQNNIKEIKGLIAAEIDAGCF